MITDLENKMVKYPITMLRNTAPAAPFHFISYSNRKLWTEYTIQLLRSATCTYTTMMAFTMLLITRRNTNKVKSFTFEVYIRVCIYFYILKVSHGSLCHCLHLQCESKKIPPYGFRKFFPKRLGIFNHFLHTYYTIISTLDYKFLFKYLQLWQSYAILSATTYRIFTFH